MRLTSNFQSDTGLFLKILERINSCYYLKLISKETKNELAGYVKEKRMDKISVYFKLYPGDLPEELLEIDDWIFNHKLQNID